MSRRSVQSALLAAWLCVAPLAFAVDALPFQHKVETYRNEDGDVRVFTLRLEQPFLADEFEQSSYLRLQSADPRAYLIYPKETKFQQKHAEFYGRLRGEGKVKLTLSYEIVSENLDGTRRVQVRQGQIEVAIPPAEGGPKSIFLDWANEQNEYFAHLLRYYPEETFFQYCLLQSRVRYGVTPPSLPTRAAADGELETNVYQVFTSSLAIQESLQRETLKGAYRKGDLNVHISSLSPPSLRSLPYEKLLEERRTRDQVEPKVHDVARLVPEDQYLLHSNSMRSLGEVMDLSAEWGNSLLRLYTVRAQDNQLRAKLEEQLCVRRGPLTKLFADGVIAEVAVTGADPFVLEGTDVTLIFRLKQPAVFQKFADGWLADARKQHADLAVRDFNYRGHKVAARYTKDRVVSSFVVAHDDFLVYSNSHRAIRRVVDAATGETPALHGALDYRYVTTVLPPSDDEQSGYLFASEAFLRRQVSPAAKISEKRRLQCFNNLVMLNNASLFYRLEFGRSPASLSDLIEGRFVDADKIICPHGGAYAFDAEQDMCTCSLHNRLKYLTPNVELPVLKVSGQEQAEYNRYKQRYMAFWGQVFDPLAVRITVGQRVKLETCVLPLANGSLYRDLRGMVDKSARPLSTARFAPSAVVSYASVPGRESIAETLRGVPGMQQVLQADPTLTDLAWLGDRFSLHLCDGETIVEIDPTRLRPMQFPMIGRAPVATQGMVAALVAALEMPVYVSIDVENKDKARRLLDQLARQVFLNRGDVLQIPAAMDAYRLPDYKGHAIYVVSGQLYAIKLRLHVALVGDQLVAATKPRVLHEVIDASAAEDAQPPVEAHMLLRLNRRALGRLHDDIQLFWAEKSRTACHRNISSIYNLCKLYGLPAADVPRLSDAKYGIRHYCPDGGTYSFDGERDQVLCSVHGNREQSRQNPKLGEGSDFAKFVESVDEVVASLRFQDEALIATVEIVRAKKE